MKISFSELVKELSLAGIEYPLLEARLLLADILNCRPSEIYTDTTVSAKQAIILKQNLKRRCVHEPLDKILGHKEFYKYDFKVNQHVLSPRPDTEILVEKVLEYYKKNSIPTILDLGTGSGCIIESLLKELPSSTGVAVDISREALCVARLNAKNLNVLDRLKFIQADWFDDNFINSVGKNFDIIVTNPPYIPQADISNLEPEVKEYDPLIALSGGESGYDSYRRIAQIAFDILKPEGLIFIEAGIYQDENIIKLFSQNKFELVETAKDLNNINRCVIMKKSVAEI